MKTNFSEALTECFISMLRIQSLGFISSTTEKLNPTPVIKSHYFYFNIHLVIYLKQFTGLNLKENYLEKPVSQKTFTSILYISFIVSIIGMLFNLFFEDSIMYAMCLKHIHSSLPLSNFPQDPPYFMSSLFVLCPTESH